KFPVNPAVVNSPSSMKSSDKVARNNRFFPNSLRFISSCLKHVSATARSASASVAASISGDSDDHRKDQVLWACFDRLELSPTTFKHVLLLGYSNGFQVLDVEDTSNVSELVSKRDDPVTFLQMQALPAKSEGIEGFSASHPLLLVVSGADTKYTGSIQIPKDGLPRDHDIDSQRGSIITSPTAVRFYSLRSHNYVHVLRFRSAVYMLRSSSQIVAVGLAAQIHCFDALTLENKFSVLTYPLPQLGGHGTAGINVGYGPMAVGPRWLAYASKSLLLPNIGRLSPRSLTPSSGPSPSTSPINGSLVARYAMESSKHLAVGLISLGDMGYKTLSKYCQEILPDGSVSPVSSNSSWKACKSGLHSTEDDVAGMGYIKHEILEFLSFHVLQVVVRDFVSRAVVSQFRAHTSPISALCFDPSGTLLVTASVHGNNINIFRIMPSSSQNGSGTQSYDWGSSHVHLYRLHRGLTSAVIQDICFSHYSQWISIVSSRGTCHTYVLSPFGGQTGLQMQNSHADGPTLFPILTLPWWSTPSFTTNQESFPPSAPPPSVTLSAVSRIKNSNSGLLNTVSNVASSAVGNVSVPSGAVAAIFYDSISHNLRPSQKIKALEHLLAYTSSGHLIQYSVLPYPELGPHETSLGVAPDIVVQMHDEELKVDVIPIRWWDVCRRTEQSEKMECFFGGILDRQEEAAEVNKDITDSNTGDTAEKVTGKPHGMFQWYLSKAEVQISSGRIPIWQNSKMYFHVMTPLGADDQSFTEDDTGGEIEIEKLPVQEIEINQRDIFPIFGPFCRIQPTWSDRCANSEPDVKNEDPKTTTIKGVCTINTPHPLRHASFSAERILAKEAESSDGVGTSDISNTSSSGSTSDASNASSSHFELSMNNIDDGLINEHFQDQMDFGKYFQEGGRYPTGHVRFQNGDVRRGNELMTGLNLCMIPVSLEQ
ncbi:BCAS3 domain, partial [Dillenia turbinata]